MNFTAMSNILEAVLFASGAPVEISDLATVLKITENEVVKTSDYLNEEYTKLQKGLQVIRLNDSLQLCTRREFSPYIREILGAKSKQGLSPAALETLSIIAYNQPITRNSISYIRGVNSDGAVIRLLERGLIEEKGRLNAPGRPILYATSEDFLRVFGLTSLSDLPDIEAELPISELDNQQEFEF